MKTAHWVFALALWTQERNGWSVSSRDWSSSSLLLFSRSLSIDSDIKAQPAWRILRRRQLSPLCQESCQDTVTTDWVAWQEAQTNQWRLTASSLIQRNQENIPSSGLKHSQHSEERRRSQTHSHWHWFQRKRCSDYNLWEWGSWLARE